MIVNFHLNQNIKLKKQHKFVFFQHVKDVRSREINKDKQTMYNEQISTV